MVSSLPQSSSNRIWANLHVGLICKNCEGLTTGLSGINFKFIIVMFSSDPRPARLVLVLNRTGRLEVGPYVTGSAIQNTEGFGSLGDVLIGLNISNKLVLDCLRVFST
jgi:hypothetical protein